MTFYEFMCCNKVYNAAAGLLDRNTVTKEEIKTVLEVLKKMADDRNDWTEELKVQYKALIEFAKQGFEGSNK